MVVDDPPPPRDTANAAIAVAIRNNALSANISLSLVLGRRLAPVSSSRAMLAYMTHQQLLNARCRRLASIGDTWFRFVRALRQLVLNCPQSTPQRPTTCSKGCHVISESNEKGGKTVHAERVLVRESRRCAASPRVSAGPGQRP